MKAKDALISKEQERSKLNAEIDLFLQKGGEISYIKRGVTGMVLKSPYASTNKNKK